MTEPGDLTEHARTNRDMWQASADEYESRHEDALSDDLAMAWGVWRIPETQLQVLGDTIGMDVLELGCGAARWSIALANRGARPVGLDVTPRQLEHASRLMRASGVDFPLVLASAEAVPLPDAGFDLVFCDWGAMTFCDPYRTVPEVARLLRPGGLFAFCTGTPFEWVCFDRAADHVDHALHNDYFGMHRLEWPDEVNFQLPYGEWIRLFRRHNFTVEDLIEPQPSSGATSTYRDDADRDWAVRWPMEAIWRVRKVG